MRLGTARETRLTAWMREAGPRKEFLAVVALALLLTALLAARADLATPGHRDFAKPWDHHKYIFMALNPPGSFHLAPFCWRIGAPLAAGLMPLDVHWSFFLLAFLSVAATGVTVYAIARRTHGAREWALLGMLLFFAMGWASKRAVAGFYSPDPLAFLLLALAVYCAVARRDVAFALVLMAGVAVKESALFAVPLYYTLNTRRLADWKLAGRTLLLALPALALLIGIRTLVPMRNNDAEYVRALPETLRYVGRGQSSYDYAGEMKAVVEFRKETLSLKGLEIYAPGPFGVLCLLPLFAVRRNLREVLRWLPFLALVYAQLLFAFTTERHLAMAFPALVLLALNSLQELTGENGLARSPLDWVGLPFLLILLNLARRTDAAAPFELQAIVVILYLAALLQLRRPAPIPSPMQ